MSQIPTAMRAKVRHRSLGVCERCSVAWATEMHHRLRRRDGGHTLASLVHLCGGCHRWAHANPQEARDTGWIVPFGSEPLDVGVKVFSGTHYFDEEGGVRVERGPDGSPRA